MEGAQGAGRGWVRATQGSMGRERGSARGWQVSGGDRLGGLRGWLGLGSVFYQRGVGTRRGKGTW